MKNLLSKHIVKQSFKENRRLWLIVTVILSLFMAFSSIGGLDDFGLYTFAGYLKFIGTLGLSLYMVIVGNKLVASEVENGLIGFYLNTPITRKQIVLSKVAYYLGSIFATLLALCLYSLIFNIGQKVAFGLFAHIILNYFLVVFAVSGITFFASCWFNKNSQSLLLGAGLPIAFYFLALFGGSAELLQYFTLYSLFSPDTIMKGFAATIPHLIILAVLGIALYSVGIVKFIKKDLPL